MIRCDDTSLTTSKNSNVMADVIGAHNASIKVGIRVRSRIQLDCHRTAAYPMNIILDLDGSVTGSFWPLADPWSAAFGPVLGPGTGSYRPKTDRETKSWDYYFGRPPDGQKPLRTLDYVEVQDPSKGFLNDESNIDCSPSI